MLCRLKVYCPLNLAFKVQGQKAKAFGSRQLRGTCPSSVMAAPGLNWRIRSGRSGLGRICLEALSSNWRVTETTLPQCSPWTTGNNQPCFFAQLCQSAGLLLHAPWKETGVATAQRQEGKERKSTHTHTQQLQQSATIVCTRCKPEERLTILELPFTRTCHKKRSCCCSAAMLRHAWCCWD